MTVQSGELIDQDDGGFIIEVNEGSTFESILETTHNFDVVDFGPAE